MIQSSHRFDLLLRRQICLNTVFVFAIALSRRPIGLVALALTAHSVFQALQQHVNLQIFYSAILTLNGPARHAAKCAIRVSYAIEFGVSSMVLFQIRRIVRDVTRILRSKDEEIWSRPFSDLCEDNYNWTKHQYEFLSRLTESPQSLVDKEPETASSASKGEEWPEFGRTKSLADITKRVR